MSDAVLSAAAVIYAVGVVRTQRGICIGVSCNHCDEDKQLQLDDLDLEFTEMLVTEGFLRACASYPVPARVLQQLVALLLWQVAHTQAHGEEHARDRSRQREVPS